MGLLWGDKTATGVKVEGLMIPLHELHTRMECVVGEWELEEAMKLGRGMGGWWLGWIHTYPNHLRMRATNAMGIHLRLILPKGRVPVAMV